MIETKDILNWCFTVAALVFGVFGFLYSTYAAANFQATPDRPVRPAIVKFLRVFCWAIALVLVVLTSLAAVAIYDAGVGPQTWTIDLFPTFAKVLARYVLHHEWGLIANP